MGRAAAFPLADADAFVQTCALRKADRVLSKAATKAGQSAAALVDNLELMEFANEAEFTFLVGVHLTALCRACAAASATLRNVGYGKTGASAVTELTVGTVREVCAALRAHSGTDATSTSQARAVVRAAVATAAGGPQSFPPPVFDVFIVCQKAARSV